jgi:hypothetical protein
MMWTPVLEVRGCSNILIEYETLVSGKCEVSSTYLNFWFTAEHFAPDMYVQYDNVGSIDIKLVCDIS